MIDGILNIGKKLTFFQMYSILIILLNYYFNILFIILRMILFYMPSERLKM